MSTENILRTECFCDTALLHFCLEKENIWPLFVGVCTSYSALDSISVSFEQLHLFCLSMLLIIFLTLETGSLFRCLLSQNSLFHYCAPKTNTF